MSLPAISSTVKQTESTLYLDTIKTAGRDLISIVNSMITLNRWADIAMNDRQYAVHSISDLETELSCEISKATSGDPRYRASVIFSRDAPPHYDSFRMDLGLLRDSLVPLIINAIQNTFGGTVIVTATLLSDSRELIVDVEDTGCGIHPDDQQRIFEPYEKVGVHSAGAGLGLTLSSKFATLLHGSVVLVSSEVGSGTHFRATFREVECPRLPLPAQPLAQRLKKLPSRFHLITSDSGNDGAILSNYFARFLTSQGFQSSDSTKDCFVIFEFLHDSEERRSHLLQISENIVGLCLIPASAVEANLENIANNIVCVNGPFLTSTMSSALEEAERRLAELGASCSQTLEPAELKIDELKIDGVSSTDNNAEPLAVLKQSAADPADPDTVVSLTHASDPMGREEPKAIVSITSIPIIAKPTALLVDDNIVNLRVMEMYCTKRDLPFYCATDGKQAVGIFSQQQALASAGKGAGIHLIIMDLQMPVCDGIEATRNIRQLEQQNNSRPSTVFIVTGQDSPSDRMMAQDVGADEYFVKPVGIKALDRGVTRYFPGFKGR